jgi:hypothetical protein
VTGDELTVADSGDELQKGTTKFVLLLAPLHDSLLPDVQLDEAHLLSYSTPSGVASMDGDLRSSGEVQRWCCKGLRGIERDCGQREVAEK